MKVSIEGEAMDFTVRYKSGKASMVYTGVTEIRMQEKQWVLFRKRKLLAVLNLSGQLDTIDCHVGSNRQLLESNTPWEEKEEEAE